MSRFILLFSLLMYSNLSAGSICKNILSSRSISSAEYFTAYFNTLLERNKIDEQSLGKVLDSILREGVIINPVANPSESSVAFLRYKHFQALIDRGEIDLSYMVDWINKKIKELGIENEGKKQTQRDTENLFTLMSFVNIERGSFVSQRAAYHNYSVNTLSRNMTISITYDFVVSKTVVTQGQWFEAIGFNSDGYIGNNKRVDPQSGGVLSFNPDSGMKKINFWSKLFFANEISKREGLEPVYKINLDRFTGSLSRGDLKPKVPLSKEELEALTPDVTAALGYRIMTEAEYSFISSNRGQTPPRTGGNFFLEENLSPSLSGQTVYHTPYIIIDGQKVYGFYGYDGGESVYGTNEDVFNINPHFPTDINPAEPINKYSTTMGTRGGALVAPVVIHEKRHFTDVNQVAETTFRLVRTLRE